jgi:hypothetical protein
MTVNFTIVDGLSWLCAKWKHSAKGQNHENDELLRKRRCPGRVSMRCNACGQAMQPAALCPLQTRKDVQAKLPPHFFEGGLARNHGRNHHFSPSFPTA